MDGEVFDLDRPLEGDCKLELLKFDDKEGNIVILSSPMLPPQPPPLPQPVAKPAGQSGHAMQISNHHYSFL